MAETLLDKRVEEFLKELPQANKQEIAEFRSLVEQYFLGTITPDEFKAKRLHMGTYGIRGTKDVHMMRVKIPAGDLTPEQLECLADVADVHSKGSGHFTTRQSIQLYWIPTQGAGAVMAKLATVGLTTREACSNSVRNITACPYAGISREEVFDVTQHAKAVMQHFLRNTASQKLPRKFKIALEGCKTDHAVTSVHDAAAVAAIKDVNGKKTLGFRIYAGGGLGAAPRQAILIEPFTPATDLLRTLESVVRVHDRLGDRKNKATARVKFVVKRLGEDAFRKEVFAERDKLPAYTYPEMNVTETDEKPPATSKIDAPAKSDAAYPRWLVTNVMRQKQPGFSAVTVRLRLGDISSKQMRDLAAISRKFCGGRVRTTIDQNLLLRWVRDEHLAALHAALLAIGLADAEANLLQDVISCPGAETCQLGIAASRGLARAVEDGIKASKLAGDDLDKIRIKISGCPNSCGQHHIADIGFFGGSRNVNGKLAPHFQLMLGGLATEGVAVFGQNVIKLPARRIPDAITAILSAYRADRQSPAESFRDFSRRVGLDFWKKKLEPFTSLPAFEQSPELYRDWGAETDFSMGGMGPGECAA